jgi:hypothetical protein
MDAWLKFYGTAGKVGGKRRKQTSTCISGETGLLDSKGDKRGKENERSLLCEGRA